MKKQLIKEGKILIPNVCLQAKVLPPEVIQSLRSSMIEKFASSDSEEQMNEETRLSLFPVSATLFTDKLSGEIWIKIDKEQKC